MTCGMLFMATYDDDGQPDFDPWLIIAAVDDSYLVFQTLSSTTSWMSKASVDYYLTNCMTSRQIEVMLLYPPTGAP